MTKKLFMEPSTKFDSVIFLPFLLTNYAFTHQLTNSIYSLNLFSLFCNRDRTLPLNRLSLLSITDSNANLPQLANQRIDNLLIKHNCHLKTSNLATQRHNLGEGIIDKFTKLSKIGFFMEYFIANLSRFSSKNVKICLSGDDSITGQAARTFSFW